MNSKSLPIALILCIALAGCSLPQSKNIQPTLPGGPTSTSAQGVIPSPTPGLPITVIPAQQGTQPPTQAISTSPATSLPVQTGATASPTITTAPLPGPSTTPASSSYTPFNATVSTDGVKLRKGPGYLFPAYSLLPKGTVLAVYGRSAGNEWIYVQTASGALGWVFALLLQPEKDWNNAPGVEPGNVLIVRGKVIDASGNPVNGIQFMLTQGTGNNELRTDATTDASGVFTAFLPATAGGTWTVAFTAISCTSRVMDQNCSCKNGVCGTIKPVSQQITFPLSKDIIFNWQ